MVDVVRRPRAEADLLEIWLRIAQSDEVAADRLIDRVEAAMRMLARNPMAGRSRAELLPDLRSFVVGRYIMFYKPRLRGIDLLRVVHGSRDIDVDLIFD